MYKDPHMSREQIEALAIGDTVYVSGRYSYHTGKLQRRTKTQLVVLAEYASGSKVELRFSLDGRERSNDTWRRSYLVTKEHYKEVAEEQKRERRRNLLINHLSRTDTWKALSDEQLEEVAKSINLELNKKEVEA